MYNQPMPYSLFTIDAMPPVNEPAAVLPQRLQHQADTSLMTFQRHSRTMTAPPTMHPHQYHHVDPPMSASSVSPSTSPPAMLLEKSWPDLAHDFLSYQQAVLPPHPSSSPPAPSTTAAAAAGDVLHPITTSTPQTRTSTTNSPPTFMNDTAKRQQSGRYSCFILYDISSHPLSSSAYALCTSIQGLCIQVRGVARIDCTRTYT